MPYPLPLTRTEAYLAYKAGVIQQSDLKPSLAVSRNGIDAWLAYWTGLAANYPKREDGTPHILQEEEAYIAYLCGVIDEYPEKCLRRVGAYLRYIISARWGRPDHPLNREELYLSLIKTQFIPSGDPSSDIEIDGTAKASFVDVKMYGDTFQQSYTGKNMIGFPARSYEQHGLTFDFDTDGTITINGTRSGTGAANYNPSVLFNFSAGDITYTVIPISGSFSGVDVGYRAVAGNAQAWCQVISSGGNYNQGTINKTAEQVAEITRIELLIGSGTAVFDNFKFKLQVTAGSDHDTNFEPFVGGQPSPSPSYSQQIQTVTGLQTVEVVGKNLFDKNHPNDSKSYVNNSGVLTSGGNQNLSVYIKCEPNTTYTVSKSNKGTNNRLCVFDTETEPAIGVSVISTVGTRVGEDNSPSYTITTGANAHYLGVFYRADATTPSESEIKDTIQIEKGSTATAYAPYSRHTHEINLGKNLFNRNDVVNGIPSASDGSIISTSSAGRTSDYIPVMSNTAYSHTGHPLGWATVAWYKADKSFIARVGNITTTTSPNEAAYARVSCAQDNLDTCQFEAGEPTEYAPYFTPIELCKLDTYQDYIWKDGDSWKVHKAIDKSSIDGTIGTWSNPSTNRFNLDGAIVGYAKKNGLTGYCKDYVVLGQTSNNSEFNTLASNYGSAINFGSQTSNNIRFKDTDCSTIQDIQSALLGKPAVIYYAIATPTDTIITNQALIDQLEALVKGGSEEGTTYIKLSTPEPNLPGLLYVEAAKYV